MKKIFLVIFCIVLSNCEIKPRSATATLYDYETYRYYEETRQGMLYGVWWTNGDGGNREDALFVINLTKEKLEIELLKKQLNAQ